MTGDVNVYGLTMGQWYIEDIGVLVPHNTVVTIPADQAYRSKDLWRAINQRKVFQLRAGPGQMPWPVPPPAEVPVTLVDQNRLLQESLDEQRTQNAALLAALAEQKAAIQGLAATVANLRVVTTAAGPAVGVAQPDGAVDGSVPTFIPSTVKPEVAEQRIHGNAEESGDTGVTDARSRLRALRKAR